MSEPPDEPRPIDTVPPERKGKIGFGTVSILVIFFGIITAMCMGAVLIVVVLAFK